MDDGDSLIGDVASGISGEFSKLGKSLASQVTGSTTNSALNADAGQQITGFGKTITGQIFGSKPESAQKTKSVPKPTSFLDELKKLGRSATAQVSGAEDLSADQISEMAQKDEEFSKQETDVLRARIAKIYDEYQEKRKKDEEERKQKLMGVEQKSKEAEILMEENKKASLTNPAIAKTRAEIKNYGAE